MQKVILLAALAVVAMAGKAPPPNASFEQFKSFHAKVYPSAKHESFARAAFQKNSAAIRAHNAAYKQGKVSYTRELNAFADVPSEVFNQRNGFKIPSGAAVPAVPEYESGIVKRDTLPASLNWTEMGKVSPVKDQGQCGSCWSFSATGAMESNVLIQNKSQILFSEQQILDCDVGNGDQGCNGGWPTGAWSYIQKNGGDESEKSYPYWSGSWGFNLFWCFSEKSKVAGTVKEFDHVTPNNTQALMEALYTRGPISIALDASGWQTADGKSVYSCSGTVQLDHAVLLVGYGTEGGKDYWLVKNSWGTGWGDAGYIKVARSMADDGVCDCGLTQVPAWVTVA